jgi:hypothetical protein
MLFTDGRVKRECECCGEMFRPHVPDQRFCRPWCRLKVKAKEGRSARRVWWRAGRPIIEDKQIEDEVA